MDRGLPSVRSARGLQGRQELGRMLVCVTDFVWRSKGNFLATFARNEQIQNEAGGARPPSCVLSPSS